MKIVIAQTNPTPLDFERNVAQIKTAIMEARVQQADLVVSPEMGIPGYLCRDAMFNQGFVEENLKCLLELVSFSTCAPDTTLVVGYVDRNNTGSGKPLYNCAAVIKNGIIMATYKKRLLPFYDVFDEGRYFEPGTDNTVVEVCGTKFALLICEDGWNDKGVEDYPHHNNPVDQYRKIGVDNFIWLNSSPFVIGKPTRREAMVNTISAVSGGLIVYVNQTGGMDDLVFDGNSFVSNKGLTSYVCGSKQGNYLFSSLDNYGFQHVLYNSKTLKDQIVTGLGDYIRKSGFSDVVVASSGGIDSALVLCLAYEAIGPKKLHAIMMPSVYSSKGSVDDASALHAALGCHEYLVPIDHVTLLNSINENLGSTARLSEEYGYRKVADENIQARLRAIQLMHFSNAFGALALTTGNKSENATGYCTLGGDMMGGFAPIQDLYKTQVYDMSRLFPQMPAGILSKAPSAELALNQTDEASLLPYSILDLIIFAYVELRISSFEAFARLACQPSVFSSVFSSYNAGETLEKFVAMESAKDQYNRIIRLIDLNEFKRRQAAPGIKVSKVAFGSGRRFPIVKRLFSQPKKTASSTTQP